MISNQTSLCGAGSSQIGQILASATFGTFVYTMKALEPGSAISQTTDGLKILFKVVFSASLEFLVLSQAEINAVQYNFVLKNCFYIN